MYLNYFVVLLLQAEVCRWSNNFADTLLSNKFADTLLSNNFADTLLSNNYFYIFFYFLFIIIEILEEKFGSVFGCSEYDALQFWVLYLWILFRMLFPPENEEFYLQLEIDPFPETLCSVQNKNWRTKAKKQVN
jgi:hypothetical protein